MREKISLENLGDHFQVTTAVVEQTSIPKIQMELPVGDAVLLHEISKILKEFLNVNMSCSEINSRILRAFVTGESYVSLFLLTKRCRYSLQELVRLKQMESAEIKILKHLIDLSKRDMNIRVTAKDIKTELLLNGDRIYEIEGQSDVIDDLLIAIEREYIREFSKVRINGGMKNLLIKSAVISLIYGDFV